MGNIGGTKQRVLRNMGKIGGTAMVVLGRKKTMKIWVRSRKKGKYGLEGYGNFWDLGNL